LSEHGRIAAATAALVLVLALAALLASAPELLSRPATRAGRTAGVLPAQLLVLEQRMVGLRVESERYSETVDASGFTTFEEASARSGGGAPHRRRVRRRVSSHERVTGLVSANPLEGELIREGRSSRPIDIAIGSTQYEYAPEACDPQRPWVRSQAPAGGGAGESYPFEAIPGVTPENGASGPYAALIELLASATSVVEVGPTLIDGQHATEFAARRLALAGTLGPELAAAKPAHPPSVQQQLDVFITESGVPIRVVQSTRVASTRVTASFGVLALNLPLPLAISAPAPSRTRPRTDHATCRGVSVKRRGGA
jgi:hypothetical protein